MTELSNFFTADSLPEESSSLFQIDMSVIARMEREGKKKKTGNYPLTIHINPCDIGQKIVLTKISSIQLGRWRDWQLIYRCYYYYYYYYLNYYYYYYFALVLPSFGFFRHQSSHCSILADCNAASESCLRKWRYWLWHLYFSAIRPPNLAWIEIVRLIYNSIQANKKFLKKSWSCSPPYVSVWWYW